MSASRIRLIVGVGVLLCCRPVLAHAQPGQSLAVEAADLLDVAPIGPDRAEILAPEVFLLRVRALNSRLPSPTSEIGSIQNAIEFLENVAAAAGPVNARVESIPSGHRVTYRRTYASPSPNDPVITTNNDERLDIAAYYYFDARHPVTNVIVQTQRKNCTTNCVVVFNLSQ